MSTFTDQQQQKLRETVKELFFASGNRILRPIVQELNEIYPSSKRLARSPAYDQEIFDKHDSAFRRARNHLYEQRNLVQRKWLLRYVLKAGPGGDSVATEEFRSIIVEGALDRLYETLVAYIPMLVPAERSKPLQQVVTNMYHTEAKLLAKALENYSATFADGVVSIAEDFE